MTLQQPSTSHIKGALLDGGGPRGLGVAVGEVVGKSAPGGGEIGASTGGADGGSGGGVCMVITVGVGGYYSKGSSSGTSGTWIDEGLGKGPVVGAIGIGGSCFLEVESHGGAIGREAAIEGEGLGDIGKGEFDSANVSRNLCYTKSQLSEDMIDRYVDVVTGLGGKDSERLLTKADIGEGVNDHGLGGEVGANHRSRIRETGRVGIGDAEDAIITEGDELISRCGSGMIHFGSRLAEAVGIEDIVDILGGCIGTGVVMPNGIL